MTQSKPTASVIMQALALLLLTACANPGGPGGDFALALSREALALGRGGSTQLTVTLTPRQGFEAEVDLRVDGAPTGVTAAFSRTPTAGTSVLTLSLAEGAELGVHSLAVVGSAGTLERSAPLELTVTEEQADPNNRPPAIDAVAAQTVRRNTSEPRTLSLPLSIRDPDDDRVRVTVESDREDVVESTSFECAVDACRLTLTPSPEQNARATVRLVVSDGRGGRAETSFTLDVVPALTVTTTADSGPGSLRELATNALPGEVIGFDPELFASPRVIVLRDEIVLDRDLTIEGAADPTLVRLSGDDKTRVFTVNFPAAVVLEGLTVIGGSAQNDGIGLGGTTGGAVLLFGGSLTLRRSLVSQNRADFGGGVAVNDGTLSLRDGSRVEDNEAARGGGGVLNHRGDLFVLEGSRIAGNTAGSSGGGVQSVSDGGAGAPDTPTVLVDASVIGGSGPGEANRAGVGGGIANRQGVVVLQNGARVSGNRASVGAGVFNETRTDPNRVATLTVDASTVGGSSPGEGNSSDSSGGGISNHDGTVVIRNGGRVEGNEANFAGGIENANRETTPHVATLTVDAGAVVGNVARTSGSGGIFNGDGVVRVQRGSVVSANEAEVGGGIESIDDPATPEVATVTVSASSVSGNRAEQGGGIRARGGRVDIRDGSAVTGNEATEDGGGVLAVGATFTLDGTSRLARNSADADGDGAGAGGGVFGRDALVRLLGEVAGNAPEAVAPATALELEVVGTDEADITLVGPDGAGRLVAASSLLLGAEAGDHVITARDVTVVRDGRPVRLAASPRTQAKLVQEGQTTSARVAYAPPLGP